MFYTLSKIHPDDRRGMAQVLALLEQEGQVNGALKTLLGLLKKYLMSRLSLLDRGISAPSLNRRISSQT